MADYQQHFKRYEKKYVLNPLQYEAFRRAIAPHAKVDQYGRHTIGNIYYDNNSYELIRKSIEQPLYKEKIRVRSYDSGHTHMLAYIELKKKFKGIVYKRRTQHVYEDIHNFLYHSEFSAVEDQVRREILWFMKRYKPEPKIYIGYDRTAYFGTSDTELRMTLDQNMRYRTVDLDLSQGHFGEPILDFDAYLLEIKTPGAMPLWLCNLLSQLEIYPQSFSKVGYCYTAHILNKMDLRIGEKQYA